MQPLKYANIVMSSTALVVATGATIYMIKRTGTLEYKVTAIAEALAKRISIIDSVSERMSKVEHQLEFIGKNVARISGNLSLGQENFEEMSASIEDWSRTVFDEMKVLKSDTTLMPFSLEGPPPQPRSRGRRDASDRSGGNRRAVAPRTPATRRRHDDNDDEDDLANFRGR
jgi:hypothetical protein